MAKRKMSADEFIKRWWKKRFPDTAEPKFDSMMTCADASDLLNEYYRYLELLP